MKLKERVFVIFGIVWIAFYIVSVILGYWVSVYTRQQLESAGIAGATSQPLNYGFIFGAWFWLAGGILNLIYDRVKKRNKIVGGVILASPFIISLLTAIAGI